MILCCYLCVIIYYVYIMHLGDWWARSQCAFTLFIGGNSEELMETVMVKKGKRKGKGER